MERSTCSSSLLQVNERKFKWFPIERSVSHSVQNRSMFVDFCNDFLDYNGAFQVSTSYSNGVKGVQERIAISSRYHLEQVKSRQLHFSTQFLNHQVLLLRIGIIDVCSKR